MKKSAVKTTGSKRLLDIAWPAQNEANFPRELSVGSVLRFASRAFVQELQNRLGPYDIPVGMFFFLRVLWEEEGLAQRELGERAGAMDSATVEQLQEMELRGLIKRRRSRKDRRKIQVYLTTRSRALKPELLQIARQVNETALKRFTQSEIGILRLALLKIRANLDAVRKA